MIVLGETSTLPSFWRVRQAQEKHISSVLWRKPWPYHSSTLVVCNGTARAFAKERTKYVFPAPDGPAKMMEASRSRQAQSSPAFHREKSAINFAPHSRAGPENPGKSGKGGTLLDAAPDVAFRARARASAATTSRAVAPARKLARISSKVRLAVAARMRRGTGPLVNWRRSRRSALADGG